MQTVWFFLCLGIDSVWLLKILFGYFIVWFFFVIFSSVRQTTIVLNWMRNEKGKFVYLPVLERDHELWSVVQQWPTVMMVEMTYFVRKLVWHQRPIHGLHFVEQSAHNSHVNRLARFVIAVDGPRSFRSIAKVSWIKPMHSLWWWCGF